MSKILIGCEESQAVTTSFRRLGYEAYSCDLKDCSGGHPEWHLKMDVFAAIKLYDWELAIFFPDCTYLTCSAEWAYKDGPYHQKINSETLTGYKRREARELAIQFVKDLMSCGIPKIGIENPVGVLSSRIRKPDQIIQPYQFGNDASKSTCLWLKNLPCLLPTSYFPPRMVNGKPRWGNQTDAGQNNVSPKIEKGLRAKLRSKTYSGIADAMALQWSKNITRDWKPALYRDVSQNVMRPGVKSNRGEPVTVV